MRKSQWAWGVLLVVSVAGGCVALERPGTGESTDNPASAPRAVLQRTPAKVDSLSTNGIWQNGLSTNGIWQNGIWQNGIWQNGIWQNGIWQNGIWQNGIWQNGIWQNGIWQNGLSTDGGFGGATSDGGAVQSAMPGQMLRASPYARKLLQYVFACAMPASTLNPPGGSTGTDAGGAGISYDTTLDPNNATLTCSPGAGAGAGPDAGGCDTGYACSAQGTCVIPLVGAIGLGINTDDGQSPHTTWWGSGTCDEGCQRWVSACVLARTNAFGVHVNISMRAPADAPQQIKDALAVSDIERNGTDDAGTGAYSLREGAYYGNIFETAPVNPAPSTPDGGPYSGPASGPVANTPDFHACAGPGSNVYEVTKRFCSSQGDQVVIKVPGVCLSNASEPGVCAGEDTDAGSPTFGAIQDCYTNTARSGSPFGEVITVYLQQPIAVCGNAVCEAGERDPASPSYCPSDCHPGDWAKDIGPSIEPNPVNPVGGPAAVIPPDPNHLGDPGWPGMQPAYLGPGMSVVAPDDTIVLAASAQGEVSLAGVDGGTLPASQGVGIVAKYNPDGTYAWGARFGGTSQSANGGQLVEVDGVAVAATGPSKGNISVVGLAREAATGDAGPSTQQAIWISTYTAAGLLVGNWSLPIGLSGNPYPTAPTLQPTRAVGIDSQGNIILAGAFSGTATFGANTLSCPTYFPAYENTPVDGALGDGTCTFLAKIVPPVGDAGLSLPTFAWAIRPSATNVYWTSSIWSMVNAISEFPVSLTVDTHLVGGIPLDDVLLVHASEILTSSPSTGALSYLQATVVQKFGSDGTSKWAQGQAGFGSATRAMYSSAAIDPTGNFYATGYLGAGVTLPTFLGGDGGVPSPVGSPPFLTKYDGNNQLQWLNYASTVCPSVLPSCVTGAVEGVSAGFDPDGNVVLASFGDPAVGGGIDFAGAIPSSASGLPPFPTYSSNNLFISTYRPAGQLIWAKQIPIVLGSSILGMAVDSKGRVIVSGNYSGSMEVDGQLLVTPVPEDPNTVDSFLASFGAPSASDHTAPLIGAIGTGSDAGASAAVTTVPQPIVAQATSSAGAVVFFMPPTAVDTEYAGTSVWCSPPPNQIFPIGKTSVACTASDPLGNTATATFTVTVVDTTPPLFSPFADLTVQASSTNGGTVSFAPTAVDQVDGPVTPVCNPPSGSPLPVGKTPVMCTATDAHGNQSQMSFSVVVTAPVSATCVGTAASPALVATATGTCSVTVTAASGLAGSCVGSGVASCTLGGQGSVTLAPGAQTLTVMATGVDGSTTSCTSYLTVIDNQNPTIQCPNETVQCTGNGGATATPTASCSDPCGCTASCATGTFPLGTSQETCSASDPAGNTASCQATVQVVDTLPPVVTPVPGPSQLQCNVDTWTDPGATATDQCAGNVSPSVKASGTVDPTHVGSYALTYSATDPSGNVGSATRSVAVVDTLAPSLTLPGTITATPTSASGTTVTYAVSATDRCVGPVTATCTPGSGSTFPPGTTAVTCTASDPAGNTTTGSFPVQVQYSWSGILQPINADGSSVFKLGSTVPVKFQLTGASAGITNATAALTVAQISSNIVGTDMEAVSTSAATTGNLFRYDSTSGQYIFNLATKGLSKGSYQLSINLQDGVSRTVTISLR